MKIKVAGLTILILLLLNQAFAQTAISQNIFTLHARLNGTHMDTVLLYYKNNSGSNTLQTRPIFNDRFIITDSLKKPVYAVILFKDIGEVLTDSAFEARSREIYIEPGRLYLTGDVANLDSLKLTGSVTNDEWEELRRATSQVRKDMKPLTERYNKEKDPEKAAELSTKFEPYEDKIKAISYRFFLNHPNSYVTLHQMVDMVKQVSLDSSRRIYNNFNEELRQTEDGQKVEAEIKKMAGALPGNKAADFTAADTAGKAIALSDYNEKYVLLDFWASWSPPCRAGNPHLADLYNKYKGKGLNIISIAWNDDTQEGWKKAIKKDGIGLWPNLLNGTGTADDISDKYAIHFIPTKILIDPSGKIVGRFGDNIPNSDILLDRMLINIFSKIPDKQ